MFKKMIIDSTSQNSISVLRDTLSTIIYPIIKSGKTIIILCIGTDRSTGDSLGPLVGDKLKFLVRDRIHIYGNLKTPVHAKNLTEVINEINLKYENNYIIAIDACLGKLQNVGKIMIEKKPLHPGSAVNKSLPTVGDLSITGIVNISGTMEFMVLQNTRLFIVMQLAEIISRGLYHSILKTVGGKSSHTSKNKIIQNI
ncbi:putative sporulation protein YyaC [Clostridium algifaecis]|uniref:Sporulation protein YyaC n=1 Tax=Clostridium algifaecis TaxID=1472040 RepID=A0ABS4KVD8_9CLOT|nr:spore protease YyaC [Clostridium algifaecis]MBP2034003.1 putative sporulation protein YyaC [Clostridium algifaecis]